MIERTSWMLQRPVEFWAFQTPSGEDLPLLPPKAEVSSRIDSFIQARLRQHELSPSPLASPGTLARRLSFDLLGLPPTAEAVRACVADDRADAYVRQVDRLLASPHLGERWARMWLDVARYAEDQAHIVGSNSSLFYPNAYLYRDWVIEALNSDLPYDQFVRLQLAADLIEPESEETTCGAWLPRLRAQILSAELASGDGGRMGKIGSTSSPVVCSD